MHTVAAIPSRDASTRNRLSAVSRPPRFPPRLPRRGGSSSCALTTRFALVLFIDFVRKSDRGTNVVETCYSILATPVQEFWNRILTRPFDLLPPRCMDPVRR